MKDVVWVGDSRERLRRFPKKARQAIGRALEYAQLGDKHPAAKPMQGLGTGVLQKKWRQYMCDDVKFEKSSGNVFKDIGFSDEEAEALSFRAKLTFEVFTLLKKSRLRRVKAAKLLAVDPADILKLKNGDDDHFSLACLSDFRDRLKRYMEGRVTLSENDDTQNATDVLGAER